MNQDLKAVEDRLLKIEAAVKENEEALDLFRIDWDTYDEDDAETVYERFFVEQLEFAGRIKSELIGCVDLIKKAAADGRN